ncbi:Ribulose bisphosphate carboxylase [Symbiodinium microadriaticum]|uniref:ribulose-bisphosphate carboxylase n=1 Tax=Symbiodinium microadriaticum TaxID=2951 RepID=A0A1Q9DR84_SYMMI|nr:Ribulose bisphosphate carboxylase [Symbiodinium microadriaticum]
MMLWLCFCGWYSAAGAVEQCISMEDATTATMAVVAGEIEEIEEKVAIRCKAWICIVLSDLAWGLWESLFDHVNRCELEGFDEADRDSYEWQDHRWLVRPDDWSSGTIPPTVLYSPEDLSRKLDDHDDGTPFVVQVDTEEQAVDCLNMLAGALDGQATVVLTDVSAIGEELKSSATSAQRTRVFGKLGAQISGEMDGSFGDYVAKLRKVGAWAGVLVLFAAVTAENINSLPAALEIVAVDVSDDSEPPPYVPKPVRSSEYRIEAPLSDESQSETEECRPVQPRWPDQVPASHREKLINDKEVAATRRCDAMTSIASLNVGKNAVVKVEPLACLLKRHILCLQEVDVNRASAHSWVAAWRARGIHAFLTEGEDATRRTGIHARCPGRLIRLDVPHGDRCTDKEAAATFAEAVVVGFRGLRAEWLLLGDLNVTVDEGPMASKLDALAVLLHYGRNGKHVLVAYIMKPKAGYDYLATAAHFAAESSTGTNVNVCTTDDFTKSVDALVYYIDPDSEEMKIAYPNLLFDRNIIDGRAMMCSFLTLSIGNNQGMGDVEYGKIYDFYLPPAFLRLYDGPAVNVEDMWRILGKGTSNGGLVVGTIIKPKLGLQPKPFGEACYAFWQGGDFIKNDEPQGNQVFCQMNEVIPEVVKAMRACIKETGVGKLFSANITADDPNEMIARGKYCMSQFGPLSENCAFLVDGYVAGGTAVTCARRNFPKQFLHYHRAGHGSVTSPQTQRGYTAFVHTKISRVIGASGIHTGTMSFGKMEGDASDKNIAFMLQDDEADGPYYHQEWEGMKQTTPIISGGMNALRLPAFFENLGHSNVILTAGGGSFGHKDGPKPGAISCRQGEEAWKAWKAGQYGNISLSDGVIEFAKTHEEIKGAFLTFQKDADQIYPGWKEKLGYTGESSVQAASFDWAKKASAAAFVGASVAPAKKQSSISRKALDQSSRYADLSLDEATLIKNGKHVLVAYIMKPKAGYDYLATAAHFAAESSTGTNVNVCTTDDFTKSVDALVYYIDPDSEEMKIAYPNLLFDRNIIDGRAMMCSFLTLSIGNNQGMGDVEYGKIYDFYLPPNFLRLYDGPAVNVEDMWRILGKGTSNGGLVVGTIIKPKLGLQPKPFGEACYAFWQGGDFIKNDEPQGNQVFCQMNEVIPEVVKAMRACIKETGVGKLFSANITADDPNEMIARGKYCMSQFGPLSENCAFLVDGYVAGGTAVTCARRNFPKQFLHYHRAGHGSVTSPQTQRGYTAFVHTKISRVIGASGIHTGTMSFGKMEGDASDKNIAFMLQDDEADGPYYHQEWEGMKQTTPIISGGMNALRLPAFFENLGHSNVILTAGGGSFGHKDGPKPGAISCRQGEEAWKAWKAGQYGNISLSDGVIEFAKTHEEIKGAFLTFQKDADQIYPGWKEKLGYTGESSVQAASFDWAKKASAAAFVGASVAPAKKQSSVSRKALDQSSRYADLSLDEATLIKNGKHVLVAYIMKPKAGYDYLATAAHFAAESSTGTNVNVCTTDDFTKSVDALVYYIDPDSEEMKIAYPNLLFDRNIIDGRAMMCSFLTLSIGNNQGMGDVEYGKIYDFYLPPNFLRLYDGPAVNVEDMWRILGKGTSNGGLVVGTIIKPKLGLQPKPFGEACYAFWQGGDFIKNDEPQGNQVFCQMNEVIPEVVKAMRACIKETGVGKLFSANITADDPNEMIARGKYCMSQFGPLSENCAFLVDGYVAGGTAVTCARRNFPKQFLHYHRAGHGSVTSPQTQRGYTAFVHTKISRVIGASGIHTGTMSFGKMEGDASDKNIAFMLQDDEADGPYYHQEWEGMKQTTPIISGGMNALRLPAFFENLGHSNVILTAGGGSFGHKDGPKPGAISCRQGEEAWKAWKAGQYGNISLSDGVIEFAKTHEEIKGAFLTFQKDADQIYPGWKEKLGYTGESSVQAASFDWAKKASAAAFVGASVAPAKKQSSVSRKALDQSSRYADLSLDEATLIKNGKHVLVAYIMKPKAGYDYLATAAHFAAESSTGTNVNVCTTDDFTKSVDALVYYIDPDSEEMKIAYPNLLFDRNIIDGRAMMCSFLTLSIGNNQGMGDVEYGKIYDFYLPPAFLRLYDGPAVNVEDMWRILGKGTSNGGLVVGTIIKPKLGLQPKPFGEACYAFWQGGDFIKNDEPQGNQVFCQMNEVIPEVVKAMRACIKETGVGKLFSANITADDPNEMIARGKYCMSQFGPLSENCAFLVDGYVAGGTAVTCARRNFPKQFLHYHRAGHGSVTSPQTQRGYTAFVHTKISRVIGASGIHTGTMSFGKMEGDASDKNIAFMLQDDEADGPYYHQEWEGMKQTTPIISGGMNALRLPAFFENLGHSNVILTAGGGSFGHKDGPKPGAISCRQGEEAWKAWKAGQYGNISLSDGVIEFAKTHEEIKGAFLTFQKDADQIYPGWKEKLGYTGESSVQAASFDWAKKASAAAFVGASVAPAKKQSSVSRKALDQSSRYADLSLDEATLIKNGKHVLVAYIMKPKAGYDYLATAAHFAAESSTGTNVNVCTTDDFTKSVDALVYYIDPDSEEMKIAYPNLLFDRNIIDGRAMMCSFLTLSIGNNQGMGDVEYGKIYDFYLPPAFLRLYDGPAVNVEDMWRILGKGTSNGGLVVGTIIKPKLGLQPKPFGEACYAFWQGGDFIKNDEPQGNQVFCQMNEVIPEVVKAMRACIKETGVGKLFSANITADDPNEMIARGKYCMSQFGPLSENCAFLVDGYVAGGTAVTCARRNFPKQFLHYHRAGHGSVTSPQTQRGYTAFVHTKISRVIGASGIHTGTMSFGKMEGDASDKNIAFMLQDDEADGPYYHQEWEGMKQTTPIISGGMNALRLPAFFENLGHSNVILTAGGGSFGHKDGPKPGAISCRQGEEAWKAWKAGQYGNISLSDGVIEFAKTHEEIKGAFLTFQKDADQIYPGWKEKLGYTGESSVQAASFDWAKKASAAAFVGASVAPAKKQSSISRKALDQSSRYADLSLDEATLIKNGKHVLVAYIMKPKAGYDYLATAAHFAAESSTGTNVNVCTTDDFTKSVDALVYYIDPDSEEMKIAYPNLLFDRNIIDGRGMMCSFLTLSIGNNQGRELSRCASMGDVEYGKIYDFYLPPNFLRLYDGPAVNVEDMWRILGKGTSNGGLVVGTIIKPKLGLQPKPFGEACYAFWQGGDFIKNDEPQGNQVFCQMNEVIPEVVKAMRACIKETGVGKLFSANITADDPNEMIARGKYCMSQFGPLSENCAFLVDGYVAGGTAVTCARRNFPKQFLHYHRAGHGSVTSPQTQRGYTAFVHTKISRVIGASGIHTGTMSFGKMEGDASDKNIAFMLQDDEADGPYYHQEWEGMKQTTPIISGGMNALRLPAFFENLGHSNVILTAGGGSFGHKDGPKPGAISCRQGEEAWKAWKAGQYGNISLSDGVIEFAKTHEEIKGAFLTFQKDADQIYPGWKEKLGYTGESSVQAASFDWAKKA